MKFNWGTGIAIFIAVFVISAVSFIIWTIGLDFNLVEKDYYPKGLAYNVMAKKLEHTNQLSEKIVAFFESDMIRVKFPRIIKTGKFSGNLWIYRPSDEKKDFRMPVQPDSSCIMLIPKQILSKGKYTLKFDWRLDSTDFYQEIELFLP